MGHHDVMSLWVAELLNLIFPFLKGHACCMKQNLSSAVRLCFSFFPCRVFALLGLCLRILSMPCMHTVLSLIMLELVHLNRLEE